MNIAILSGNDSEAIYENQRIAEELKLLGSDATIVDYNTSSVLGADPDTGLQYVYAGEAMSILPDAVITRVNEPDPDSVKRAQRFLEAFEALGVPLTLSSSALDICKDKMSTHNRLVAAGIPTPRTAMPTSAEANDIIPMLKEVEPNPNRRVIIKKVFGTKGIGVMRSDTRQDAIPIIQTLVDSGIPISVQQYIETRRNGRYRDFRHVVIGGVVEAGMLRESTNDFRTNLSLNDESEGGASDSRGRKCRLYGHHKEISIGAGEAIGARVSASDIFVSVHGGSYIGDLNGSPGFRIENITKINVAKPLARYAIYLATKHATKKS